MRGIYDLRFTVYEQKRGAALGIQGKMVFGFHLGGSRLGMAAFYTKQTGDAIKSFRKIDKSNCKL